MYVCVIIRTYADSCIAVSGDSHGICMFEHLSWSRVSRTAKMPHCKGNLLSYVHERIHMHKNRYKYTKTQAHMRRDLHAMDMFDLGTCM